MNILIGFLFYIVCIFTGGAFRGCDADIIKLENYEATYKRITIVNNNLTEEHFNEVRSAKRGSVIDYTRNGAKSTKFLRHFGAVACTIDTTQLAKCKCEQYKPHLEDSLKTIFDKYVTGDLKDWKNIPSNNGFRCIAQIEGETIITLCTEQKAIWFPRMLTVHSKDKSKEFDLLINTLVNREVDDTDEKFQQPEGVYCEEQGTPEYPTNIPSEIYYDEEFTQINNRGVFKTMHMVYFNHQKKVSQFIFQAEESAEENNFTPASQIREVHDFNQGTTYSIDTVTNECKMRPVDLLNIDDVIVDAEKLKDKKILKMMNIPHLFDPAKKHMTPIGLARVRGVIAKRYNGRIYTISMDELVFDTYLIELKTSKGPITVPIKVVVTFIQSQKTAGKSVHIYELYNFRNYDTPGRFNLDVSQCYSDSNELSDVTAKMEFTAKMNCGAGKHRKKIQRGDVLDYLYLNVPKMYEILQQLIVGNVSISSVRYQDLSIVNKNNGHLSLKFILLPAAGDRAIYSHIHGAYFKKIPDYGKEVSLQPPNTKIDDCLAACSNGIQLPHCVAISFRKDTEKCILLSRVSSDAELAHASPKIWVYAYRAVENPGKQTSSEEALNQFLNKNGSIMLNINDCKVPLRIISVEATDIPPPGKAEEDSQMKAGWALQRFTSEVGVRLVDSVAQKLISSIAGMSAEVCARACLKYGAITNCIGFVYDKLDSSCRLIKAGAKWTPKHKIVSSHCYLYYYNSLASYEPVTKVDRNAVQSIGFGGKVMSQVDCASVCNSVNPEDGKVDKAKLSSYEGGALITDKRVQLHNSTQLAGACIAFDFCHAPENTAHMSIRGYGNCYLVDEPQLSGNDNRQPPRDLPMHPSNNQSCVRYQKTHNYDFQPAAVHYGVKFSDIPLSLSGSSQSSCATSCIQRHGALCMGYALCKSDDDSVIENKELCLQMTIGKSYFATANHEKSASSIVGYGTCREFKRFRNSDGTPYSESLIEYRAPGLSKGAMSAVAIVLAITGFVLTSLVLYKTTASGREFFQSCRPTPTEA